ncbi:MAG: hypothetical protein ACJA0Q_000165 [Saprospiraceae bacterium]|jgi:hypothetical protein
MKNYLFAILLSFVFGGTMVAQQYKYELVWNSIDTHSEASNPEIGLSLSNGFVDYENGNVPSYSCLIPIGPNEQNLKTVNTSYTSSSLTKKEVIAAKNITKIQDKLIFNVAFAKAGDKHYASVKFPALLKINGKLKKITSVHFDLVKSRNKLNSSNFRKTTATESGVKMDEGKWFKFSIVKTGPQKIPYEVMIEQGIISGVVNSDDIKLYGNESSMLPFLNSEERHGSLKEMNVQVVDGDDDLFEPGDYLMFYGEAGDLPHFDRTKQLLINTSQYYADSNFVFLTVNTSTPKRINTIDNSSLSALKTLSSHDQYYHHENNWTNFIKSGRTWVGEDFQTQNPLKFTVKSPSNGNLTLKVNTCARSTKFNDNVISVIVNGDTLSKMNIPIVSSIYYNDYVKFTNDTIIFTSSNETNTIEFFYHNSDAAALGWLDYFTLNYNDPLELSSEEHIQLFNMEAMSTPGVYEHTFTASYSNTILWDVSDYNEVSQISTSNTGSSYSFKANSNSSDNFIAFTPSQCHLPVFIQALEAQELNYKDIPEMLIVSHPLFLAEAQRLADFHSTKENLKTRVVNAEHIYNHKSSGRKEAGAIRDFIKYLYDHPDSGDSLKYVLLFGSGSYDPKNRLDNNKDFIPTYQSENSIKLTASYITDDFYGVLDDHEGNFNSSDQLDISVGRFPVKTLDEAKIAVDKITQYYDQYNSTQDNGDPFSSRGSWQNNILFIADDGDVNEHMRQAEILATIVDTSLESFNISKIYIDAFVKEKPVSGTTVKDVNRAIHNKISNGALLVNYTGHGGEYGWGSERFLNVQDILKFKNKTTLPLLMTATCEFSRFDDPARKSAGEYMFLQKDGGAIALFTTVRLVFSIPNFNLNKNFYNVLIEEQNNETIRIGDLFRKTKIKNNAGTNDRNFTLLGDPALRLAIPKKTILLDSIVAWDSQTVDTLKALTQATIHGHVENSAGVKQTSFNGTVEIKIFDKKIQKTTLDGEETGNPFKYVTRSSLLFKTIGEVKNGIFSSDIIIPKNILSNFDYSKISLFAISSNNDAKGSDKKYLLGGVDENAPEDNAGPEIQVYLNDSNFSFGDRVPSTPYFIAKLSDESGINITSNNIENNLLLTLNKSLDTEYMLNEQYQTDLNTYKTGSITYQLSDITKGSHTLEFKASDNHNNSSKFYTEFIIEEDATLALEHVLNYPNPFTTNTGFYFEQNQVTHSNIEVLIQVYTITGKIIKTIFASIDADKKLVGPISWDGKDDYGDPIGRGVYLYRIKVSAENGTKAEQIEKLVILK